MKVTYRWLQEFTPHQRITRGAGRAAHPGRTRGGVAWTPVAPPFSGVVVGEVLESGRHPDAAKLSVCQVTTDGKNRLQIICGASNVRAGLKVAVAMVGARLPNDVIIKRATLRGLESNGMLCSARELGLGDEHDGIMELPDSLPLNQNVREALDLDDSVSGCECDAESRRLHERVRHRARLRGGAGAALPDGSLSNRRRRGRSGTFPVALESPLPARCSPRA